MALVISTEYTDANPPDASYPDGSFKNVSAPAATDGTPLEKAWPNDIYGFLQKLTDDSGITPSGVPDTVVASDYYDSLIAIGLRENGAKSLRSFNLVANMVAATDLNVGDLVITRGYLALGVGSALYRVVASGTGTADGGQFINLDTHQAQLLPGPVVTASQYGAVGDGATDDAVPLNNLLAAFDNVLIDTNSASTVDLTSQADATVTIANVLEFGATALQCIIVGARSKIVFTGIGEIQGDGTTATQIGVKISSADSVSVSNPKITACRNVGIDIVNSAFVRVSGGSITGADVTAGILIGPTGAARHNHIVDVDCSGNANGITLSATIYNVLDGVVCNNCTGAGIDFNNASTYNIITNAICNSNAVGVDLFQSNSTTIDSLICNGNGTGISLESCNFTDISGLSIDSATSHGVAMTGTSIAVGITHSIIINCDLWGILGTSSEVSNLRIVGCHFAGNSSGNIEHATAGNRCTGDTPTFVTEYAASQQGISIVNGALISFGGVVNPTNIVVTTNNATYLASVTAIGAATFTLGLYDITTGLAVTVGTAPTILYFRVSRGVVT